MRWKPLTFLSITQDSDALNIKVSPYRNISIGIFSVLAEISHSQSEGGP